MGNLLLSCSVLHFLYLGRDVLPDIVGRRSAGECREEKWGKRGESGRRARPPRAPDPRIVTACVRCLSRCVRSYTSSFKHPRGRSARSFAETRHSCLNEIRALRDKISDTPGHLDDRSRSDRHGCSVGFLSLSDALPALFSFARWSK